MTTDSTAAFEADANREDETAKLKARLAELEATKKPGAIADEPEVAIIDPSNSSDAEVEASHSVEVEGVTFRFHVPKRAALLAFSLGASAKSDGELSIASLRMFLKFHLVADDFEMFLEKMMDPESPITDESMGDIIEAMVKAAEESPEMNAPTTGPRR
ncbi:hypothetical protein [uncultured Corynebacterium sp.]|uniref:hypothetical protein n=1 Tax=uncultured Corynebacterium sp. TaxID=159447 RepID=UPI0026208323|nr:hypothetical protein [uncultured Corynebacterium sp.]